MSGLRRHGVMGKRNGLGFYYYYLPLSVASMTQGSRVKA